jgi:hypothetical protein
MRTPLELLDDGWKALVDGLGLADALRYKALFQPGKGDYVREREQLFEHLTMDDWVRDLARWESERAKGPGPAK